MPLKNGLIEEKDLNGKVVKSTEWLNGKKNGWETIYDVNGNYVKRIQYLSGKKVIEDEYYKGILSKHTPFANGKKEGIVIEYQNGIKILETTYANGKKDGLILEYYPDTGRLKAEKKYINGKRIFQYEKSYYPSGNFCLDKDDSYEIHYLVDNNIPSYKRYLKGLGVVQEDTFYTNGRICWTKIYKPTYKNIYYDLEGNEIDFDAYLKLCDYVNFPKEEVELMKEDPSMYFDEDDENYELANNIENEDVANNYCMAMQDLCEIAESLDLLGLITVESVKEKLHTAVESYRFARKNFENVFGEIQNNSIIQ